jgi:hypothetical protein
MDRMRRTFASQRAISHTTASRPRLAAGVADWRRITANPAPSRPSPAAAGDTTTLLLKSCTGSLMPAPPGFQSANCDRSLVHTIVSFRVGQLGQCHGCDKVSLSPWKLARQADRVAQLRSHQANASSEALSRRSKWRELKIGSVQAEAGTPEADVEADW